MPRYPSYRRHKASGLAVVTLNGRDHYLGPWDSEESRSLYDATIARWIAGGRRAIRDDPGPAAVTVAGLVGLYLAHAASYYRRPDGRQTARYRVAARAWGEFSALFGARPLDSIGPAQLVAIRDAWDHRGLARKTVRDYTAAVRGGLRWAALNGLCGPSVPSGISADVVRAPAPGRPGAGRQRPPVRPIPDADLARILAKLVPPWRDFAEILRLTGMRPGELLAMRPMDVDRSGDIWTYRPPQHKTAWRGGTRTVAIGPRAQAILRPLLERAGDNCHVFSPAGGRGGPYHENAARAAFYTACRRAGVARAGPSRLRHNHGTTVRTALGIEAAQIALGHSRPDVTLIYAEIAEGKAAEIARAMG